MVTSLGSAPSRRSVMIAGAGLMLAAAMPRRARAASAGTVERRLVAAPARLPLVGRGHPDTDVWSYDGSVPGPEVRLRQGERLKVTVENRLPQPTTIHWHGVRVPNAMDGVPYLTQKAIEPGTTFTYEFDLLDAGTFWYHPHHQSSEQVGRGLSGPLIVEERDPVAVDRDVVWMLGDWRLNRDASISDDFGNLHDVMHAGRLGNTVTVNGRIRESFALRAGERLRLRLVNAANARIFGLVFEGHDPQIIALDGQPVDPHAPDGNRVVLGPAQRIDLILDATAKPGARFRVLDTFYEGLEYRLLDLVYGSEPPLRDRPLDAPMRLRDNPLAEPDLAAAERHEVAFSGGMMGSMSGAIVDGERLSMAAMMRRGLGWTLNGVAAGEHSSKALFTIGRGRSCVLALANDTAWHHPIHLHGHNFRVISRDGRPTRRREWLDTLLMAPRERAEVAFVADNPGDWMIHCHVLEHQAGGMSGVIRVA
ncbi:multicopper oxidase family protein [Chelatococcus sp. SYSU_G07232]|uniref:Multicopper oxidase family protein n=1 Tax=Chelatococcus albus TaxID=3047466 RepID=A0ABT7AH48_9HYPH|nr:multicopper oxidase family protein [Chelatococcus sp. SYSU_G07232]MDJ1158683.1 multicopper oxidase family protein [Chelatococcus sp. SYSU_G07232]